MTALTFAQLAGEPLPSSPPLLRVEKEKPEVPKPTAAARAIALAIGATTWAEVKISTDGPVTELTRLNLAGYYKLELIQLVLLSAQGKKTFKEAVEKRGKGASLRSLSQEWGVDYDKLYESSLAVEEIVDAQYLPRFPERSLRRERP
jgi:hypothetical protein